MRVVNTVALGIAVTVVVLLLGLSVQAVIDGNIHYLPRFLGGVAFISFLATGIALRQRQLVRDADESLAEFRGLSFDDAVTRAAGQAVSLPPGLVAPIVKIKAVRWAAFEREGTQFIVYLEKAGETSKAALL